MGVSENKLTPSPIIKIGNVDDDSLALEIARQIASSSPDNGPIIIEADPDWNVSDGKPVTVETTPHSKN